ncbi:protein of unknown function (plasmid) [Cupriavidus taiwanensis]|uniref:Uncharacterized protein n=1 Tax=Cupriavidus taiwanensis TaxID=164546 RepID=A0A375HBQ9_9BURK|nr:protein of unknown function [Cupriavidus taiwanensis]SPA57131.1 protein of unknown function [Cupriavidus taiwanensis]SPD48735.1 protein of unknown function [Cupriavidus taiwanensis]
MLWGRQLETCSEVAGRFYYRMDFISIESARKNSSDGVGNSPKNHTSRATASPGQALRGALHVDDNCSLRIMRDFLPFAFQA